jgi:ATP-dependent Clp protease ATP-binding subunit ClpA
MMDFQFTKLLKDTIAESNLIAIALGSKRIDIERLLLAMLKIVPEDIATQYMTTLMLKDEWKAYLQDLAKSKISQQKKSFLDAILPKSTIAGLSSNAQEALKNSYLEAKKLNVKEIGVACLFLAILQKETFENKLDYQTAQNFIQKVI